MVIFYHYFQTAKIAANFKYQLATNFFLTFALLKQDHARFKGVLEEIAKNMKTMQQHNV